MPRRLWRLLHRTFDFIAHSRYAGDKSTSLSMGKPAGARCVQLDDDNRCMIFGDPRRPEVCASLRASVEMCGANDNVVATRAHAMKFLSALEAQTR